MLAIRNANINTDSNFHIFVTYSLRNIILNTELSNDMAINNKTFLTFHSIYNQFGSWDPMVFLIELHEFCS